MTRYGYDDGGQLQTVDVDVRGATPTKAMVTDITYDARGRREAIAYGNDTDTAYTYAADSQRLTTLVTTRTSDSATLQDLRYFYDAVGNLVEQQDHAQQTVFFNNTQVSPHATYEYDALYRLTQAKGRERVGLAQAVQTSPAYGVVPEPGTTVLRLYTRNYSYDAVGNLTQLAQVGNWTRNYSYAATSNQLLSNSAPGGGTHSYSHSARGAMTQMPHLSSMTRDWRDQLRGVALGGGDDAVYHYDADGQRVRKVVRLGANTHDRVYLGAWELYDKAISGTQDTVRETLHVFDDRQRLAMVETLTVTNGNTVPSPTPRYRYQLDNHLGTACLELDDAAAVITYEEYHPFGTTSWHAEKSTIQVSKKRYRYTGMEKDEETGLSYHGARYYAPWLGRWCACDPLGLGDGVNRYAYVGNSPIGGSDPTGTQTVPVLLPYLLNKALEYLVPAANAPTEYQPTESDRAMTAARHEVEMMRMPDGRLPTDEQLASAEPIPQQAWMTDPSRNLPVKSEMAPPLANEAPLFEAVIAMALPGALPAMVAPGPDELALGGLVVGRASKQAVVEAIEHLPVKPLASKGARNADNVLSGAAKKPGSSADIKSADLNDWKHSFSNIVENFGDDATRFDLVGGDGVRRDLYQLEGSLNGKPGVFEWIIDEGGEMTHRFFKEGGQVNGVPIR